jgi:hypothetical protein
MHAFVFTFPTAAFLKEKPCTMGAGRERENRQMLFPYPALLE